MYKMSQGQIEKIEKIANSLRIESAFKNALLDAYEVGWRAAWDEMDAQTQAILAAKAEMEKQASSGDA